MLKNLKNQSKGLKLFPRFTKTIKIKKKRKKGKKYVQE
jgi:hypothetical protein